MKIKNTTSKNRNKILFIKFYLLLLILPNISLKSQPNIKINFKDKTQKEILAKDFKKISFKEIEDPKPIIQANDFDFETFDIKETEYKKTKIKVANLSNEADLIISNFEISDTINFKTNIKEIINSETFTLLKGQSIEIDFEFTPQSVGLKECRVKFISNAIADDEFIDLKGEAIDTIITSIKDVKIVESVDETSYIVTLPPYPNPTQNEVTAKFYWDNRINIEKSEIGVFDLNGNKVSNNENLNLEILNEFSANIKWNCDGVQSGTYLIKIQNGNNLKYVKVIVN